MNVRYPDPEPRDAFDDVLDEVLAGADDDLQVTLSKILDVDAGIVAIIGSTWPQTASPTSDWQESAAGTDPVTSKGWRVVVETEPSTPGQGSATRQITAVEDCVTELSRNTAVSKFDRAGLHDCVHRLDTLERGLRARRISRQDADRIIDAVRTTVRSAATERENATFSIPSWARPMHCVTPAMIMLSHLPSFISEIAIAATLAASLLVGLIIWVWSSRWGTRKRQKLRTQKKQSCDQALGKLDALQWTVRRLFDDASDRACHPTPQLG
jgi:hypothetical protein